MMYEKIDSEAETNDLLNEFLDLRINEYLPQFRDDNKEEYEVIMDLLKLLNSIWDNFNTVTSQKDLFLLSSIIELKRLFQSAVLLFERGIPLSANIIIRSILELSLNIVEIIRNEEYVQDILGDELREANSTVNVAKEINRLDLILPEITEGIQKFDDLLEKAKRKRITVKNLALKNGFGVEYLLYRTYCCNSHISASVLADNFKISPSKITFEDGIQLDNFKIDVSRLISIVIISIPSIIEEYFNDEALKNQFDLFCEKFETVFK